MEGGVEIYKERNGGQKFCVRSRKKNIYLIFCWKIKIPLLEEIKFDLVIQNVYEQ